jgi:hypothetical protein
LPEISESYIIQALAELAPDELDVIGPSAARNVARTILDGKKVDIKSIPGGANLPIAEALEGCILLCHFLLLGWEYIKSRRSENIRESTDEISGKIADAANSQGIELAPEKLEAVVLYLRKNPAE